MNEKTPCTAPTCHHHVGHGCSVTLQIQMCSTHFEGLYPRKSPAGLVTASSLSLSEAHAGNACWEHWDVCCV